MQPSEISFERNKNSVSTGGHRGLMVVDDRSIRRQVFEETAKIIKKITTLEKGHVDFLKWDKLLYQNWYNLTFRKELQEAEKLEARFRTLSTFHLHLNYIAKTSQVSLPKAYQMLQEEEAQYQSGDETWRFVIEKLRSHRFENANKIKAAASHPSLASLSAEAKIAASEFGNLTEVLKQDDSALSGLKRYARAVYHYLNDVDDSKMAQHLSDESAGYLLFKETFQIAMKCGDWKLLGRIWKAGGSAFQKKLLKPMPPHLKEFLLQILSENLADDPDSIQQKMEESTAFRSIYRKLVRLLHPDSHQSEMTTEFKEWSAKKWLQVQAAYKAHDFEGLKRLEVICLAELGKLNSLTLDEIQQSVGLFQEELDNTRKNLKLYRRHPAWKFSTRRRYDSLVFRLRRELKMKMSPLEAQVKSLELNLKKLELMSEDLQTTMLH